MIVSFGSINVDMVFRTALMPVSGQTLLAKNFRTEAGGKGANQALAAARDGAKVVLAGAVGNDDLAATALRNLADMVDLSRLQQVSGPTGCATIQIDDAGHNMIVVAVNANMLASSDVIDDALLKRTRILLLQMENDVTEIEKLILRARAHGVTIILNLAPSFHLPEDVLSLCDIIVVNEDEADALAGWLACAPDASALAKRLSTGIVRTRGADGVDAHLGHETIFIPAVKIYAIDTTAAGDCFVGVFAAALDRGMGFTHALERANRAAAIACSRNGSQASIPTAAEINKAG